MIIEAGLKVIQEDGYLAVNARNIAKKAGFSTQPIYQEFSNMEEVKEVLNVEADKYHQQMIRDYIATLGEEFRYMAYGMGFVRFAREEKKLFHFLFLEEGEKKCSIVDNHLGDILDALHKKSGLPLEKCALFHEDMADYTYGLAVTCYNGRNHMSDEGLIEAFSRQYRALWAIYQ